MTARRLVALALAGALAGCGQWQKVGSDQQPDPATNLTRMFDMQEFYKRLGRLAAGDPLPFIGSLAAVKGDADTVLVVVGLSLENRALSFQKEKDAYAARYRVDVTFQPAAGRAVVGGQDETVRVASFQETQRADESILFQQYFKLAPGEYKVAVQVRDASSGNMSRAEQTLALPAYGPGSVSAPVLAYQVRGRDRTADPLQVVLNNRGTVAYGGDTLLAYVEGYDFPGPTSVPFRVIAPLTDSVVYSDSLRFRGGLPIESQVLRLRPDSMALGEMQLQVGTPPAVKVTNAVVSLSTAWLVTNLDEMIDMLRWFRGADEQVAQLRRATPEGRAEAWSRFWKETDPNASTPENEALNSYFARIALASRMFRDEGLPGWRTERGEVFLRLGEPDEIWDAGALTQARAIRWSYIGLRLVLIFRDDGGMGRFRLTPESRAEFERVAARLQR